MSDLTARVAELAANGVYEPGAYVKSAHLAASDPEPQDDGSMAFYVNTTEPNTDRETVKVTVSPA